jgi:pimeloyl-ACP methyl ester carboxylesterase
MFMKKLLIFSFLAFSTGILCAQTRADYDNVVNRFQGFYNQDQPDSVYNMFSEKIQASLTPEKTKQMLSGLHGQFGAMKSHEFSEIQGGRNFYKSVFDKSTLTLVVVLNKENRLDNFRFIPSKPKAETIGVEKSNFVLNTTTGDIFGTLTMPEGGGSAPVVLIIAGSGPTDRDGNNPAGVNANTYKMLADSLQKAGIASLRYDKRGIAESTPAMKNEESLSFEDMVNDAQGMVKKLKEDGRFSKVYILGHSEGSLIGMIVAEREKVDGYISVAGIAERADKIMEQQISAQSPELGAKSKVYFDSLLKGKTVHVTNPDLESIFRASVQPYMRSWLKYNPCTEIKKLKIPVMILQGTTDIQVKTEEASKLKNACPTAKLVFMPGMNHVLKDAPEDREKNIATYSNPDLPLSTGLVSNIDKFVLGAF